MIIVFNFNIIIFINSYFDEIGIFSYVFINRIIYNFLN